MGYPTKWYIRIYIRMSQNTINLLFFISAWYHSIPWGSTTTTTLDSFNTHARCPSLLCLGVYYLPRSLIVVFQTYLFSIVVSSTWYKLDTTLSRRTTTPHFILPHIYMHPPQTPPPHLSITNWYLVMLQLQRVVP